jgi:hypothetical protein
LSGSLHIDVPGCRNYGNVSVAEPGGQTAEFRSGMSGFDNSEVVQAGIARPIVVKTNVREEVTGK